MTREELSNKLIECREQANCAKNEMCRRLNVTFNQVQRVESNSHNYSIDFVLDYLRAISYKLTLANANKSYTINSKEQFSKIMSAERQQQKLTVAEFAKTLGVSIPVIKGIEHNASKTSVDKFLQCFEGLGYSIDVINVGLK